MAVLLGNGDATFQKRDPVSCPLVLFRSLAVGELNRDGKLDLAVVSGVGKSYGLYILLGDGDGTLQSATGYPAGANPDKLTIADFNGDGYLDAAVVNPNGNSISVLLGNGDGTFQKPATYPTGSYPTSVTVADFKGDGKLDLAAGDSSSDAVSVLLETAMGRFKSKPASPPEPFLTLWQ